VLQLAPQPRPHKLSRQRHVMTGPRYELVHNQRKETTEGSRDLQKRKRSHCYNDALEQSNSAQRISYFYIATLTSIVQGTLLVFRRQLRNRMRSYSYALLYYFITKTALTSVASSKEPYLWIVPLVERCKHSCRPTGPNHPKVSSVKRLRQMWSVIHSPTGRNSNMDNTTLPPRS
jgi:hypothetical protein